MSKPQDIDEAKIAFLAEHVGCGVEDVEPTKWDPDCAFEAEGGEYLVLSDEEREERWGESLQNYLDECILPELPEDFRFYFDEEAWKRDARNDGCGHCLATYDGNENEELVELEDGSKVWVYIYRTN